MEASAVELEEFFGAVLPVLDERQARLVAGAMARGLGRGGKTAVAAAAGMGRKRVTKGAAEVAVGVVASERLREPGGGDRPAIEKQPGLLEALDEMIYPETRGTPMSALRWTVKSTRRLAGELVAQGFKTSTESVRRLLHQMGYSLQAPAKTIEGTTHPDRDGQFEYLNGLVAERLASGEPVISVDAKKKELIGNYRNAGQQWRPRGDREKVNVHDFADPRLGEYAKAIPYGVYDIGNDEGWVSVGDVADTAEFAVESIRRWWNQMGRDRFPGATRLLICADAGGSNGHRVRAWKHFLAAFATETGLEITVVHYPPGTSKWNKIEHRMFSFISMNWKGVPLTDIGTIVELIAATTTDTGLTIQAAYDPTWYPTGVKITKQQLAVLPLTRHAWHGDWNYTLTAA